ncbi:HPr-rel-A system PqqD family peptide chaperone [Thauera sp. WH-1]|uniref:HPr-rel-A system PqqD family peptide chaperone n=1 Tax=Thauera sp. WH-1 TaxID=3398230 RepID=UPI0039FC653D
MKTAFEGSLIAALDEFEWRTWSGDAVVYHAPSGHTYLIRDPAGSILKQLESGEARRAQELLDQCRSNQPIRAEDFTEVLSLMLDIGILVQS